MILENYQIKEGLLKGDAEVFRYLYRAYGGIVVGYVKKNSGSAADAKEMLQTVLLELWNAVKEGRYDERGKLDRYIYMLTANTWRDELRRRKVRRTETIDDSHVQYAADDEQSLAEAMVKNKYIEAVHHCLEKIAAPCSEIIRHYHLEDKSLQDIAAQMNYDYNNLRKRIFDCRKKLRKMVDEHLAASKA